MKNYSIIKYLFVILLCAFFASCNQEELQKQNEAAFIDLIKNQIEMNDEELPRALKQINKQGSRTDDRNIYKQMLAMQIAREKVLELFFLSGFENIDSTLMKKYEFALITPPEIAYGQDTINHYVDLISQDIKKIKYDSILESNTQKMAWVSQYLVIEYQLLEYYQSNISYSCGFGIRANTFSDNNSQVDKPFEILISSIPSRFEGTGYRGEHYVIVPSFEFWIDGVKTQVEYKLERIEDVGVLYFTPPKKGEYYISGHFHTRFDNDEPVGISHKVYHSFEVE